MYINVFTFLLRQNCIHFHYFAIRHLFENHRFRHSMFKSCFSCRYFEFREPFPKQFLYLQFIIKKILSQVFTINFHERSTMVCPCHLFCTKSQILFFDCKKKPKANNVNRGWLRDSLARLVWKLDTNLIRIRYSYECSTNIFYIYICIYFYFPKSCDIDT